LAFTTNSARTTPDEYRGVALRAHSLLTDVPLHDVWALDLPGGDPGFSMLDLRSLMKREDLTAGNRAVRFLIALRRWLGRVFRLDAEPDTERREPMRSEFLERLSQQERDASLVPPLTADGPFRILLVTPRESISEIRNATVHAFSVFALVEGEGGYRFYWAIYVRPVGGITAWYMKLIDPFRRFIIYPAILGRISAAWASGPGRGD
jgi:hypothetical protein